MPIAVCSICQKRPHGRLASIYWAKWSGDNGREAWKQKFDKACYDEVASSWLDAARASFDADGAQQCVLCDATDVGDLTEVYGTIFLPGAESDRFTVLACLKHLPTVLKRTQVGSQPLPDRDMYPNGGARATGW
jgi:hypothetical protein